MPRMFVQLLAIVIAGAAIVLVIVMPRGADTTGNEQPAQAAAANAGVDDGRPRANVTASRKSVGTSVGNKAPSFELADARGNMHALSDYLGQVVVLDFWGTWCAPCRRVMPALQAIHDTYHSRGVNMIGISCNEKPGGDPVAFMVKNNYDYGLLLNGERITPFYGVTGYPTLMVIGVDGEILYSHRGANGPIEQQLSDVLDAHLATHGL